MKTKIKSNYHTHTFLCKHAIGDVEDYVKRAIELGYHSIAITDHGPFPKFLQKKLKSRRMTMEQYDEIYLDHLNRAKNNLGDKVNIFKGVEIEYLDELKPIYPKFQRDLDLMILGQHYIKVKDGYKSIYQPLTADEIKIYAQTIVDGIESGLFKVVAHPEIFMWNIREWNDEVIEASKQIITSAIENNVILEINVNGVRNSFYQRKEFYDDKGINFAYPRREFWELAKSMNAKVMINDDAHAPNRIQDEYTLYIYEIVEKIGLEPVDKIEGLNYKI